MPPHGHLEHIQQSQLIGFFPAMPAPFRISKTSPFIEKKIVFESAAIASFAP
jgi:hypothetical protein